MLKYFILEAYPVFLLLMLIVYLVAKYMAMNAAGVNNISRFKILKDSLMPVPKQFIKNLNNHRLERYYKSSNVINFRLYLLVITATIFYGVMYFL